MESSYDGWEDKELEEAAKGGDREARNALFMRYRKQIAQLCWTGKQITTHYSKSDGSITPEDVDQQTFLIFYDLLDSWEPGRTPFPLYLRSMMPSEAVHYVRSKMHYRSRRKPLRLVTAVESGEIGPQSAEAMHSLEEVEDRAAWAKRTEDLNAEWKRLIKMRYEEGLSSGEIAALDGHSHRTVNRHLRAATDAMREKIQDEWEGCG